MHSDYNEFQKRGAFESFYLTTNGSASDSREMKTSRVSLWVAHIKEFFSAE